MERRPNLGLVSMLLIMVIAAGACIEKADENPIDLSDNFVHPGIGFEDVESREDFIDAYGIRPESEMRTKEWNDKLEEVHDSLAKEFYELEEGSNLTLSSINESGKPTMNEIRKALVENDIDISSGLAKYYYGGEKESLIASSWANPRGYIMIALNINENVSKSQQNEIYSLYYKRGLEHGIDNIPVVFCDDSGIGLL